MAVFNTIPSEIPNVRSFQSDVQKKSKEFCGHAFCEVAGGKPIGPRIFGGLFRIYRGGEIFHVYRGDELGLCFTFRRQGQGTAG